MDNFILIILALSGLILIGLVLYQNISVILYSIRWTKGLNLMQEKSNEEVFALLQSLQHPSINSVTCGDDGKIVINTKLYPFPVDISCDGNKNTIIKLRYKSPLLRDKRLGKTSFLWNELYLFIQQEASGNGTARALSIYEKNQKIFKVLKISAIVCLASFILFEILG